MLQIGELYKAKEEKVKFVTLGNMREIYDFGSEELYDASVELKELKNNVFVFLGKLEDEINPSIKYIIFYHPEWGMFWLYEKEAKYLELVRGHDED